MSDQDEAFELTLQEWRKKATPAHLAVYATRSLPDDSDQKWRPYRHHLFMNDILVNAATDTERRFVNMSVSVRAGKALAMDTPILTADGWKKMGELQVGDRVFAPDGTPTRVVAYADQPPAPIHRLSFDDGSHVDAHPNHEWLTFNVPESSSYQSTHQRSTGEKPHGYPTEWWAWRSGGRGAKSPPFGAGIRTSAEIAATVTDYRGHTNHRIPVTSPIQMDEVDLPIDPWVLGYWLGNGTVGQGQVTTGSMIGGGRPDLPEVIGHLVDAGYEPLLPPSQPTVVTPRGLRVQLRDLGVLRDKHVPSTYLSASRDQRLALLRGLMDADGGAENSRRSNGRVAFTSTDKCLADAVTELFVSLGAKVTRDERPAKLYGVAHGTAYRVATSPPFNPFTLARKAEGWAPGRIIRQHRMVTSVDVLDPAPTRCIQVDHPSHLFLAGESLIPTHNSMLTTLYFVVWFMGMYPDKRVAIICHSGDFAATWGDRARQLFKQVGPELFGLTVSKTQDTKARWDIEGRKGGLIAVGIGAAIEGEGIDLGVMDDLLDADSANSPTEMRKAWEWYQEGFRPRLMPGSTVVMVMSRWRVDDPAGRIEEQMRSNPGGDQWETIHLPALAECPSGEDPETWTDALGRKEGEALWPEVWPVKDLLQTKASIDPMIWESRYQQNPTPREGGMFKVDAWMRRPAAPDGLRKVRCWDLAATKDGGDYTVGVLMGMDADSRAYVLDVQRFRKDGNEVKRQVLATAKADGKNVRIRIEQEKAGAGKAQIADFKRMLMGWDVKGVRPDGSKEQRAAPYASAQQDGNVYLVNSLLWDKDWVEEHRVFGPKGRGRHDDQVDAASGAFDELNSLPPAEIIDEAELTADTVVDWIAGSRSNRFMNV